MSSAVAQAAASCVGRQRSGLLNRADTVHDEATALATIYDLCHFPHIAPLLLASVWAWLASSAPHPSSPVEKLTVETAAHVQVTPDQLPAPEVEASGIEERPAVGIPCRSQKRLQLKRNKFLRHAARGTVSISLTGGEFALALDRALTLDDSFQVGGSSVSLAGSCTSSARLDRASILDDSIWVGCCFVELQAVTHRAGETLTSNDFLRWAGMFEELQAALWRLAVPCTLCSGPSCLQADLDRAFMPIEGAVPALKAV